MDHAWNVGWKNVLGNLALRDNLFGFAFENKA